MPIITGKNTSHGSPNSPTRADEPRQGLKLHLYRRSPVPLSEYITLAQLARELSVDLDRVAPLVQHRYLRILDLRDSMAETVVARPKKAAMAWLRTMFMPLELRPFLSIADAGQCLSMTEDDFRSMCVTDNVPLYSDPVFGELISLSALQMLINSWLKARNARPTPIRTDRQALTIILASLKRTKLPPSNKAKTWAYSTRLEGEITRIARLPEPDRTIAATAFWQAFNDADKVTDCLEPAEKRTAKMERKVRQLGRIAGFRPTDNTGESSSGAS